MSVRILFFESDDARAAKITAELGRDSIDADIERVTGREEFLAALHSEAPDLIIADADEAIDGDVYQVLLWARNINTSVPVILITGPKGDRTAVEAMKAGASDYILTDDLHRLPESVRAVLREREEHERSMRCQKDLRDALESIRENQKLASIGRLAGMITHEINNPLEAIGNLLFLMKHDESLSKDSREYLRLADQELARVAQISHQTLSFYREANQPVRLKPQDLLEEVLGLYSRKLRDKQIHVRRRYELDEPVLLYPGEMRQVFSNLIVNAIDAMSPDGTLTVHVYCSRKFNDQRVDGVRIVVADTGSGITAERLRRIGEPFFTTKGQRGTGLGLWVTQSILKKYGGGIQIASSTNPAHHGTVFSIFLPGNVRLPSAKSGGSPEKDYPRMARESLAG